MKANVTKSTTTASRGKRYRESVSEGIRDTMRLNEEIIRNPDAFPADFLVLPADPDMLPRILTRERLRILQALRVEGRTESVTGLADRLGRDVSRVSRDLDYLEGMGLVSRVRDGKRKIVKGTNRPILLR